MIPRCPKCGEPAREVIVKAKVTCELDDDGSVGVVIKGRAPSDPEVIGYQCGGFCKPFLP